MADPRFPERGDDISELVRNRQQRRPGPTAEESGADAVGTGADAVQPEAARTDVARTDVARTDLARTDVARTDMRKAELVKADDVKADLVQTDPKDGPDAAFGPPPVPAASPVAAPPVTAAARTAGAERLLQDGTSEALRRTWRRIQHDFVDNPNKAVAEADSLVQHTAAQVAAELEKLRTALRDSWNTEGRAGAAVDGRRTTEELRLLLQEYRKLLNKLLDL